MTRVCVIFFNYYIFCFLWWWLFSSCLWARMHFNILWNIFTDPKSREVVLNACKAVGSISNTSFDIRFNPDIFSPGMAHIKFCTWIVICLFDNIGSVGHMTSSISYRRTLPWWQHWGHPETEAPSQKCCSLSSVLPDPLICESLNNTYLLR